MITTPYLSLLRNHIDITTVPFSDRGSRLLIFQDPSSSRLMVKLAERLTNIEPDIEAYLRRPPFISDLRFVDDRGDEMEYETLTSPNILYFSSRLGDIGLVFQDRRTISIGLPPNTKMGVCFHVTPQYWKVGDLGGVFKAVRNLAYRTTAKILENQIHSIQGGYDVELIVESGDDDAVALTIYPEAAPVPEILPFSVAAANAEMRWMDWFRRVPPVAEPYRRTYAYAWWIMANNLISPQGAIKFESMAPSKISYVGLWLWDNAMHSLAFRHIDSDLARNQIRGMLAHQLPSGMIPDAVYDEGIVSRIDHPFLGEVTKPPILAWAALKLHETDPDLGFLEEIYAPMSRLNAWWFTYNDDDGDGLAQYNHPYSSGLDDSPLWDYGMPVESPDLNTYLCVQMGSLATMAEILELKEEAVMWRRRASAIVKRMTADMWDAQAGVFWALKDEKPVPVLTPFNLFPLWTGQLPQDIRNRLIEHLTNPAEFWGQFAIPTVARNDSHYDPNTMWRGPIWANINYFFIEALFQVGSTELARDLRTKTLDLIMSHANICEFYNAENGEVPATAAEIFGWTAAVFIDLAIQATKDEEQAAKTEAGQV